MRLQETTFLPSASRHQEIPPLLCRILFTLNLPLKLISSLHCSCIRSFTVEDALQVCHLFIHSFATRACELIRKCIKMITKVCWNYNQKKTAEQDHAKKSAQLLKIQLVIILIIAVLVINKNTQAMSVSAGISIDVLRGRVKV